MSSAEPPLGAGPRAAPAWQREILERKRAKLAGAGGEPEPPAGERLVVAESLGPLRENPFMRLESERRRLRQGRPGPGGAARPLQQLLELYSAVPGIRTIRADNILIIESRADPAACFSSGDAPPARRRDPAGADPLRELLARRGAALAEIRADQVVIYETAEPPEPPEAAEPGTVSRLLEKFGQRPRGRRRRVGDALIGTGGVAAPPQISSNSFTVTPRGQPPSSRVPEPGAVPAGRPATPKGPPVPSTSPSHARANARRPKPEEAEVAVSPLPSASPAPSATGAIRPLSASAPRAGGSFEIHPAPKPDLAAIPAHDLQAQALAKLRLNSRNSFVFVPRREGSPARPPAQIARPGPPPPPLEEKAPKEPPRASAPEQEESITSPAAPLDPLVPVTYIDDIVEPDSGEPLPRAGPAARTGGLADQPGGAGPDLEMEFSSVPLYRPHSAPQQRGGSTFTVVPKRKPVAPGLQADASGRPQREEDEEEEDSKGRGKAVENADGPQVGISHKKRYPTVNEIEVIGGYLSLERSCMSKTGSRRKKDLVPPGDPAEKVNEFWPGHPKSCEQQDLRANRHEAVDGFYVLCLSQLAACRVLAGESQPSVSRDYRNKMKISFNETSLQTMFEYPSESSLAEEDEEEEGHASETEEEKSRTFYIPRPNSTLHPSTPNSADLSSYTPKHSVKFSEWQEQKYEGPAAEGTLPKEADSHGNQVMGICLGPDTRTMEFHVLRLLINEILQDKVLRLA
ncbi:taperin [Turdus rufiventris]|nr:taperin [Turdus rufiventris]